MSIQSSLDGSPKKRLKTANANQEAEDPNRKSKNTKEEVARLGK